MNKIEYKTPCLVCVYGTLRRNQGNHRRLADSKFLGEFKTDPNFTMFSMGGFPGIFLNGKNSIICEVFEVADDRTMQSLDSLEGYPDFYNRTQIDTPWGKAWVYHIEESNRHGYNYPIIESGDWINYIKNKI